MFTGVLLYIGTQGANIMSQGKYSPRAPNTGNHINYEFKYNCHGEIAPHYHPADQYVSALHFTNYDEEGFDAYGYSAFYRSGIFAGHGCGIDRLGYTENEYMVMSHDEWMDCNY